MAFNLVKGGLISSISFSAQGLSTLQRLIINELLLLTLKTLFYHNNARYNPRILDPLSVKLVNSTKLFFRESLVSRAFSRALKEKIKIYIRLGSRLKLFPSVRNCAGDCVNLFTPLYFFPSCNFRNKHLHSRLTQLNFVC